MRLTVRRPASAEVSPCCHRPSGGDIACGVHVSITCRSGHGRHIQILDADGVEAARHIGGGLFHPVAAGQIPREPGMTRMFSQRGRLLGAGQQSQPAHRHNIEATTDNLPKGQNPRMLSRLVPRLSAPRIS